MTLTVIHDDEALLVVDKPAGLLAVPGRGADKQDCLSARVQAHWPDALVVHRLDMATSGLMLFARGAHVQRRLSLDFAARRIEKHYVAVVDGRMPSQQRSASSCRWPPTGRAGRCRRWTPRRASPRAPTGR